MRYRRYSPAPPLRDAVAYLWCLTDGPAQSPERILPTGAAELVINLRDDEITITDSRRCAGDGRFSGAVLSGPYTRSFDIDASAHTAMLGVHFTPGGAQSILGMPLSRLTNSHIDLEHVWGAAARTLRMRVCKAQSAAERVAILHSELMSQRRVGRPPSVAANRAVRALTGPASPTIGALVDRSGLSHHRLIDIFTANVGMTPKVFSRLRRFRRALDRIEFGAAGWAEFAVQQGYSDQPHMIREFRAFSGLTPTEHLRGRAIAAKDHHVALAG